MTMPSTLPHRLAKMTRPHTLSLTNHRALCTRAGNADPSKPSWKRQSQLPPYARLRCQSFSALHVQLFLQFDQSSRPHKHASRLLVTQLHAPYGPYSARSGSSQPHRLALCSRYQESYANKKDAQQDEIGMSPMQEETNQGRALPSCTTYQNLRAYDALRSRSMHVFM